MFLKLTSPSSDEKIRININKIISYVARLGRAQDKDSDIIIGSYICINDDMRIMVKEKPEEIDGLLASSYVTVKERYEDRISKVPQHPIDSNVDDSKQLQSGAC